MLSVRDAGGPRALIRTWGVEPRPRVAFCGEPLDGLPPEPHARPFGVIGVTCREDIEKHVQRLAGAGASGIKLYYRFPPQLVATAVACAHEAGLRVAAHLGSGALPSFCLTSPEVFGSSFAFLRMYANSSSSDVKYGSSSSNSLVAAPKGCVWLS